MIFPWHAEHWQHALHLLAHERLAHANLLTGPAGIGKLAFCLHYMQTINCTQPGTDQHACEQCGNCRLFKARTHPDVRWLNVDEAADQIKVDDIREINEFMVLSRQQGAYKIVCINHAERINTNAANALLKTLEEPPANSVLFLVSQYADRLLATIRSRCQTWKFRVPDKALALAWLHQQAKSDTLQTLLAISGDRPLLALALHETGLGETRAVFFKDVGLLMKKKVTPTSLSAKLQNTELEQLVVWQQAWCTDLIRCHYASPPMHLENPDLYQGLHQLVGRVNVSLLFGFWDKLIELRRLATTPLNKRLFIEDMLIRCQECLFE